MKKFVALGLVILLAIPAGAAIVEGQQVMYVGGSIADMKPGAMGRLDITDEKELIFEAASGRLAIPYHDIRSFSYSKKLARRTGVLATVVVVLIKRRQRRHFIEVSFTSPEGTRQVAIFEVSKDAVQSVVAVLRTRALERRANGAPVLDCNRYPAAPRCREAVAHGQRVP